MTNLGSGGEAKASPADREDTNPIGDVDDLNVDQTERGGTMDAALEHAGVRALLADVLSVEAVRAYKPDPRVYELATERFACAPRDIIFVSSNAWDAWGAARFGFRVAWCNRAGNKPEPLTPAPETTLASLHELDAWVRSRVWKPE